MTVALHPSVAQASARLQQAQAELAATVEQRIVDITRQLCPQVAAVRLEIYRHRRDNTIDTVTMRDGQVCDTGLHCGREDEFEALFDHDELHALIELMTDTHYGYVTVTIPAA